MYERIFDYSELNDHVEGGYNIKCSLFLHEEANIVRFKAWTSDEDPEPTRIVRCLIVT